MARVAVWGHSFGLGKRKVMSKTGLRALTCLSFHQPHVSRLRTFKGLNKLANLHEILIRVKFSHLGGQLEQSKQPTSEYMEEVNRHITFPAPPQGKRKPSQRTYQLTYSTREPAQSYSHCHPHLGHTISQQLSPNILLLPAYSGQSGLLPGLLQSL